MYETYWQLDCRPFENDFDPSFYYPSDSHQSAMLKLRYVLEHGRGAAVLSGAGGLGKTHLIEYLARQMRESCSPFAKVVFPQLPADQLVAYLADELWNEVAPADIPTHQHVRRIEKAIQRADQHRKQLVVVIDEAQLLDHASLETVRLLLNLGYDSPAGLTLILVGQPALLPTLDRLPELDDRLNVKCLLRRFAVDESVAYMAHRMKVAGARGSVFTDEALEAVHHLTHGNPRHINRLCDLALLVGFAEELRTLGPDQIAAVADELVAVSPE